jgi:hypothetical protein
MSRKECVHGSKCGYDLCPLDKDGLCDSDCSHYVDSGYRRKPRKTKQGESK